VPQAKLLEITQILFDNLPMQKIIRAKKSLGQNFLIDNEALFDISDSLIISEKHIIEVGPGYGALTEYIVQQQPKTLDLVELDQDMIQILEERVLTEWKLPRSWWNEDKIQIIHQDILTFTPEYERYSVIANIPYYITSPILFHFLYNLKRSPEEMTIMMQKEVWEKILEWRAKKPHHSYLSLAMELACENISLIRHVSRTSFNPPPKVDSIVLKFTIRQDRDRENEKTMLNFWKIAFTHPRKTLFSNIKWSCYDIPSIREWIWNLGYDDKVRAEAIAFEDWKKIL
jgi:16S rRNA (adenine1518-N6/adenine1519-N6)-dimethyltransferase